MISRWTVLGLIALGGGGAGALQAATLVPGITEPVRDSLLSAAAAGMVEKIHFKEGDRVESGAVIVELDQALERLEVERRLNVYESRAELEAAEQRVNVLLADYESTRRLYERSQSVSRDEFEKKELEYKLAVAERDRLAAAKERERLEHAMAKEQLTRRAVVAPYAGVITDLRLELGESCEPRQPVVRLVDLTEVYLVANVVPAVAASLRAGADIPLRIQDGAAERTLTGRIEFVAPVVDAGSGLVRVKVRFENHDGSISPGAIGQLVVE